jgi:ribosomal protein L7Ae-like RNA K-turn-binding protein
LIDKDIEGPKRGGHLSSVTEQACGEIQCDLIFVFSKDSLGKAFKKKSSGSQCWYEEIVYSSNIKKHKYW